MEYTEKTKKAMRLCLKAHEGQVDKGGFPYVFHPIHVAESVTGESCCVVGLLHDVVEDCPDYPLDKVVEIVGLNEEEKVALNLLTHKEGVPYEEYCKALSGNRIARKVKIADLRHNLDLRRMMGQGLPRKYQLMTQMLEMLEEIDATDK